MARECGCTETQRCVQAHALRDRHQQAITLDARMDASQAYTEHLSAAGVMAYPTTATPAWHCTEACDTDAPCRTASDTPLGPSLAGRGPGSGTRQRGAGAAGARQDNETARRSNEHEADHWGDGVLPQVWHMAPAWDGTRHPYQCLSAYPVSGLWYAPPPADHALLYGSRV